MTALAFDLVPEFRTTDLDEATDALSRVYVAASLTPFGTESVNMQMKAVELALFTAGYLGFGADVTIQADDVTAYYIDVPLSGRAMSRWRDGGFVNTTAQSFAVFTPGTPCVLDWSSDCSQICLKIPELQMQRQLEAMLNKPVRKRINFARQFDLGNTAANDWHQLVQLLAREVGQPTGLLNHRLALENLQLLLIHGLLQIQPHNYTDALTEDAHAANAAAAKHAIDLMHAHPEQPWSTAHLARSAGVSARALQRAFERSDLPSPLTYLRQLRLLRVKAELTANSPDSATVTMIAGRWGFTHLGRFASQYRRQFGETPSKTLRNPVE